MYTLLQTQYMSMIICIRADIHYDEYMYKYIDTTGYPHQFREPLLTFTKILSKIYVNYIYLLCKTNILVSTEIRKIAGRI